MKEESLLQKAVIGTMIVLVFVLMAWVPDFTLTEKECSNQPPFAITKGFCSELKAK